MFFTFFSRLRREAYLNIFFMLTLCLSSAFSKILNNSEPLANISSLSEMVSTSLFLNQDVNNVSCRSERKQDVMKKRINIAWRYITISLFFIMLMSSCRNRVKSASDNLNQSTTIAAVDESYQEKNSNRIYYAPNGDIVDDEEGIYIIEPIDTNEIFIVSEYMPMFPGGSDSLLDYLSKNVRYPEACLKDSIQGRVIVSFVVERDGSLSNVEVVRYAHELLDAEALRVVKAMPKWTPGRQRGVTVRVQYRIPVNFRLEDFKKPVEWIDYDEADPVEEDVIVVME